MKSFWYSPHEMVLIGSKGRTEHVELGLLAFLDGCALIVRALAFAFGNRRLPRERAGLARS